MRCVTGAALSPRSFLGLRDSPRGLPAVLGAEQEPADRYALQGPDFLPQRPAEGDRAVPHVSRRMALRVLCGREELRSI